MSEWNHVICIDAWRLDEEFGAIYPEGAREKTAYFSPAVTADCPLKKSHRYLFKKSVRRAPWQFWMEVIAYRIGKIMNVAVPPAYIGMSNLEKPGERVWGALIEWFYSDQQEYIDGGSLIREFIPGFNDKTGEQHNLQTILAVPSLRERLPKFLDYWAAVLTFDTVIGNTDRHQVNWGVVTGKPALASSSEMSPSPAFDNGTALAYELSEEQFARFDDEAHARRYLTRRSKARHHMRWSLTEDRLMNFYEFVACFVQHHPETKDAILKTLAFSQDDLHNHLDGLCEMSVEEPVCLTRRRLEFTIMLVMKRRSLLLEALEKA
jgi:hypothetical protein